MILKNDKISKEVSRQEERKNDSTYQSIASADTDAFNNYGKENDPKVIINIELAQEIKSLLNSISFPIHRDEIINIVKNRTNNSSISTFFENIPDKKYSSKTEIIKIIED